MRGLYGRLTAPITPMDQASQTVGIDDRSLLHLTPLLAKDLLSRVKRWRDVRVGVLEATGG